MTVAADTIYLTGFMGVGKSTLGRALAKVLHCRFVDMDAELTQHFGMPIAEVFESQGEAVFREAERAELQRLSQCSDLVVATGGGVPVDVTNRAVMRGSGTIVMLHGEPQQIRKRLSARSIAARPLWHDAAAVEALFEKRREAYADCDLTVDALGLEILPKVALILRHVLPDRDIPVSLDGHACPVCATVAGPEALIPLAHGRRVVLLTDQNVARHHLERYRAVLPDALTIVLQPGEGSKSLTSAEHVYRKMLDAHVERRDLLVALGGGVVTDFGAFVAATFKRGMDFALVSTSLLGCVDAAVGGKSAVNVGAFKNQVGLFTLPKQVVLDRYALSTLPTEQVREGLVEAYKTGIALDPALSTFIEQRCDDLMRGNLRAVAHVASASAEAKGKVVTVDFREKGLRRVLNLGHTYGHAVETWHRCRISHGQSVAAGLIVMAELSRDRGLLADDDADRIIATVLNMVGERFALPTVEQAWPIMLNDKKNAGGRVTFVLLKGIGDHVCVDDLQPDELDAARSRALRSWQA